jgi:aminoglycoside phosphotransferase (APT) family kinase protein
MTGVELERADGSPHKIVIREVGKWSFENYPNSAANEKKLLSFLRDSGVPVATPRFADTSCEILQRPYVVLDYVEGSPDLVTEDRARRVTIMAETLATIHSLDIAHPDLGYIEPSAARIRPIEPPTDERLQETKIRTVLGDVFPSVSENSYRFRHGDFWPGNMVWKNDELAAVIDWEEASIGDPLFDVAITRLDTLWAYGADAMDLFTAVYQSKMDLDYSHLPWWDLRVSLRPMSNIAVWATSFPPLGRPEVTAETMSADHRWFVDSAIEKLGR